MATYHVIQSVTVEKEAHERERLIEAPTKAAALRKVAEESITAEVATTEDIVRLARAGVELEKAE